MTKERIEKVEANGQEVQKAVCQWRLMSRVQTHARRGTKLY